VGIGDTGVFFTGMGMMNWNSWEWETGMLLGLEKGWVGLAFTTLS
jgi:hypothetical protein